MRRTSGTSPRLGFVLGAGLRAAGLLGALGAGSGAGWAQMVLPGAVVPAPDGAGAAPAPAKARPRPVSGGPDGQDAPSKRGTPIPVAGVTALVGRTLALDGGASQVTFGTAADRTVAVSRLTLVGHKISNVLASCTVEVPTPAPLPMAGLGRPNGVDRDRLEAPACPIAFDVLNGAILVSRDQPACTFPEADCTVPVAGLWGATPADLGPDRIKGIEHSRATAEAAVRGNYKALTAATKDRPTIMGFARDQAQFSSSREETCRDYADEGKHGFCAARLTEARAAALYDRLNTLLADKAARKAARRGRKAP